MPISTSDCKALLAQDDFLLAAGAKDGKGWKRLSKNKVGAGVLRVFQHSCGVFAKVLEVDGKIYIQAAAVSQAELDDEMNQRKPTDNISPVAQATSASTQEAWCWPRMSEKGQRDRAASLVNALINAFDDDDETYEALFHTVKVFNPPAIANQYTFAVIASDEGNIAIITPTCYWENEGYCYDQASPIEHLLPENAEDLNDCGTWLVPMYSEMTILDVAKDLLARGFNWSYEFQTLNDTGSMKNNIAELKELIAARKQ